MLKETQLHAHFSDPALVLQIDGQQYELGTRLRVEREQGKVTLTDRETGMPERVELSPFATVRIFVDNQLFATAEGSFVSLRGDKERPILYLKKDHASFASPSPAPELVSMDT